ncbi:hypothetical protein ACQFX6_19935 [Streptomyces sp. DSM 41987]|uniref:hypothetical protein n=1 Tax=Streptomyces TaxID=1883 RepID=UPI0018DF93CB|nr:hypothetical protein [Streptomyces fildesensis]
MLSPEEYADAPPIIREINTVLHLVAALRISYTPERERELQLRKAALLDRIALATPDDTDAADVAADAAQALFDLDNGEVKTSGDHPQDEVLRTLYGQMNDWIRGGGPRRYVRQQYAAYSDGPPVT